MAAIDRIRQLIPVSEEARALLGFEESVPEVENTLSRLEKSSSVTSDGDFSMIKNTDRKVSLLSNKPTTPDTDLNIDMSQFSKKSDSVNIENLNPLIGLYLSKLPENLRNRIVITSGNDSTHAKGSAHYHDNAVDLRYDKELHDYIVGDDLLSDMSLSVIRNANHGTAPHTHIAFKK